MLLDRGRTGEPHTEQPGDLNPEPPCCEGLCQQPSVWLQHQWALYMGVRGCSATSWPVFTLSGNILSIFLTHKCWNWKRNEGALCKLLPFTLSWAEQYWSPEEILLPEQASSLSRMLFSDVWLRTLNLIGNNGGISSRDSPTIASSLARRNWMGCVNV